MICGSRRYARAFGLVRPRRFAASLIVIACCLTGTAPARADALARANTAYARGDYVRAVNLLIPLALNGNPRAQAFLGFMSENGFGAPQAYDAAADMYCQAALRGNPFAQAMLGLLYDKGHGVPQDFVLAYKWLNLAAARAPKRDRDYYVRLRNAVASKMSQDQIAEGQHLALRFAAGRP
ncbi:sel1 repeat family protein [Bradyrhizobium diazoefficiens]|nr:tetratricopeptide repeat protein [Bradyrhizobium diazoefficiens]QQO22389.1 sel1 repeat family protein [Bradyrhizobium diazoefficiens]